MPDLATHTPHGICFSKCLQPISIVKVLRVEEPGLTSHFPNARTATLIISTTGPHMCKPPSVGLQLPHTASILGCCNNHEPNAARVGPGGLVRGLSPQLLELKRVMDQALELHARAMGYAQGRRVGGGSVLAAISLLVLAYWNSPGGERTRKEGRGGGGGGDGITAAAS